MPSFRLTIPKGTEQAHLQQLNISQSSVQVEVVERTVAIESFFWRARRSSISVMKALPDKQALRDELVARLIANLEVLERSQQAAVEGATHAEAKPESDKDTRGLEQSYLARGQALRIEELRTTLLELRAMPLQKVAEDQPISLGALVVAEENDKERIFFLAPYGGGSTIANGKVQVVTPRSPLVEKCAGDDCEVMLGGSTREFSIVRVA
jgi:transcription elongation GreA/GreB family factor